MSKNQITGTATQPQRNRTFCQIDNDQYCNSSVTIINNNPTDVFLENVGGHDDDR